MRADDRRILEQVMRELGEEIRSLEQAMAQADPKLRETYSAQLSSIQERRHRIETELAELRLETALAWEKSDFATGLERVVERVTRGMDRPIPRR